MTAVNKDGQIYWTFEDLDLEGSLEIALLERDKLRIEHTLLCDLVIKHCKSATSDILELLDNECDLAYKKVSNMHDVVKYLSNLKYGRNWNYTWGV